MKDKSSSLWKKRMDEQHTEDAGPHKTNIPMAIFLLTNTMIGAIIVMPITLKEAGFGLGIILIIAFGILNDYTLKILIHAGRLAEAESYPGLMRKAFGAGGYYFITFILALYSFYIMVAANVVVSDMGEQLVILILGEDQAEPTVFEDRWFVALLVNVMLMLPLSLLRNITFLSEASIVAIVLDYAFIAFMAIRYGTLNLDSTEGAFVFARTSVIDAVGILVSIYIAHHAAFLVYDSMFKQTEKRWGTVSDTSTAIAIVTYLTSGVLGYITFTGDTQGDILQNYCPKDVLISIGRFFFLTTIALTFPIPTFVVRDLLVKSLITDGKRPLPLWGHILITTILVGGAYGVSLLTSCLSIVVEIAGFVAATPIALICPPLAVIKLSDRPVFSKANIPLMMTALMGVGLTCGGTTVVVFHLIDGKGCEPRVEPDFCGNDTVAMMM